MQEFRKKLPVVKVSEKESFNIISWLLAASRIIPTVIPGLLNLKKAISEDILKVSSLL